MTMHDREASTSAFGHVAIGGGAEIHNSPINITINISIGEGTRLEDDTGRPTEAARALGFLARLIRRSDNIGDENGRGGAISYRRNGGSDPDAELMRIIYELEVTQ